MDGRYTEIVEQVSINHKPVQVKLRCAATQAAVLFRPSKDKLDRRKEARHLVATNPALARDVAGARDKLGRFVSAGELCEYTQLSPDRIADLRDLMIFP